MSKLDKVKTHLQENKKTYLVGAGALVVGVVGTYIVLKGNEIDSVSTVIKQLNIASSPVTVISTHLERRGHPGNMIRCNETGEVFASQARAATLLDLNASHLSQHLRGMHDHVKGLTFTHLGEAS